MRVGPLSISTSIWALTLGAGLNPSNTLGQGLYFDFTSSVFQSTTGFYGSARVIDNTTAANNYYSSFDTVASSLLTYTSPSPKMVMGPSGTLQFAPHNLILDSENCSTANWQTASSTKSATGFTEVAANSQHSLFQGAFTVVPGFDYRTVYEIKGNNRAYATCLFTNGLANNYAALTINLTTGATSQVGAGSGGSVTYVSSSVTALSDGYFRVELVCRPTGSITALTYQVASANAATFTPDVGGRQVFVGSTSSGVFVRKAHFQRYPSDTTYLTTGSSARYGLPFEWNTPGTLQGILVEEQRTNIALQSNSFATTWTTTGLAAPSSGAATSPDGTVNAWKWTDSAGAGSHVLKQSLSLVSGTTYTLSLYAKAAELSYLGIYSSSPNQGQFFNLTNGTAGNKVGGALPTSSTITSMGNGWYRCSITITSGVTGVVTFEIYSSLDGINWDYIATGGQGIYIYGAQHEAGAFPTSYIQTVAASVARAADNLSIASSLFPTSVYQTFFAEVYVQSVVGSSRIIGVQSSNTPIYIKNSTAFGWFSNPNSVDATVSSIAGRVARDASANDGISMSSCGDGGSVQTANYTLAAPTVLYLGNANGGNVTTGYLRKIFYIPRRLSDMNLQTLSSTGVVPSTAT